MLGAPEGTPLHPNQYNVPNKPHEILVGTTQLYFIVYQCGTSEPIHKPIISKVQSFYSRSNNKTSATPSPTFSTSIFLPSSVTRYAPSPSPKDLFLAPLPSNHNTNTLRRSLIEPTGLDDMNVLFGEAFRCDVWETDAR